MVGQRFAIERSELLRMLSGGRQTFAASGQIDATWRDQQGNVLGEAEYDAVVPPPVEWPEDDRSINASPRDALIVSRMPPPDAAHAVQFRRGSRVTTYAVESVVEPWVTRRVTKVFGGDQTHFEISVFSELFNDFGRFESMVRTLYEALRLVPPFSRIDGGGKLRMVGYYAPTTAPGGHFRTVIAEKPGERRVNGDLGYARSRLKGALRSMPALILIDSSVGGGAGGSLNDGLPYWPAWASLGSMAAGAGWEDVAIHELAHGFGLSDEYIDAKMATREKPERYENVSDATLASALSWNDLAGLPASTALPTHNNSGTPIGANHGGPPVAAYQGAFYSNGNWRPSQTCRMRDYEPGGFCPVCSRIILHLFGME